VTLITSARNLDAPYGAEVVPVDSDIALRDAVLAAADTADALIMAAAVADFRPRTAAEHKIKKAGSAGLTIELAQNPDILLDVKAHREETSYPRIVVGFAAESEHAVEHGREKLIRKGLDMLVVNDITASDAGFDVDTNRVILLTTDSAEPLDLMSKANVSEAIIARVAALLE
jgi:phosphopantothenoylcysteine decarboxylase/phosphopantothenate--cysteine ligase